MRKSIFEIENRIDINKEYKKLMSALFESDTIYYHKLMSLFDFINEYIFNIWEDRDTFVELEEFFTHIGLTSKEHVSQESFLNFLELMINLIDVLNENYSNGIFCSIKVKNIFEHNIPIILEKLNYKIADMKSRKIIIKRDADVDSVLEIVPESISNLLLSYNDIRCNNIESKKSILKNIDLYLESDSNKKIFKSLDSKLWDSIATIVNKMGVNHPIQEEPFLSLKHDEIIKWYDKCFKMMIHLIRMKEIKNYKNERDILVKHDGGIKND